MKYIAQQEFSRSDTVLANIVSNLPEPRVESTGDVFFDLMSCILEQQIHYRSTKGFFQKMLDAASVETLTPENFYLLEQRGFGSVNLAQNKIETAHRVIDFWDKHSVDWQDLKDEEVRSTLSSIKGVGNWSIDMILLFTLERPDVFPVDDFHLKQLMTDLYRLDPRTKLRSQMIEVSTKWGKNRSIAVKYLLAWKECVKKSRK